MIRYFVHIDAALVDFDAHGAAYFKGTHPFHAWDIFSTKSGGGYLALVTSDEHMPDQLLGVVTVFPSNPVRRGTAILDEHLRLFDAFNVKRGASYLDALAAAYAKHPHPALNPNHA